MTGRWREVVDRAGGRCECRGACGRKHSPEGRCTREHSETAPLHAAQHAEALRAVALANTDSLF